MRMRSPLAPRRGYVLYIVLVVVVVLSMVAYQYADAMASELAAAQRAHEPEQARANAVSGVFHAAALLTDPAYAGYSLEDDASLFAGQPVGLGNVAEKGTPRFNGDVNMSRGGGRFSVINLADEGSGYGAVRRYGLEDEGRKLNVNAFIQADPVGNALHDALVKLPNMTEDIADSIVDWVDVNDTPRPAGVENEYYIGLDPPYRCKNGPLSSLEELLLVKGVTPDLLFGADRNRNGVQDESELSEGTFTRGWCEFLTCYGREINVDTVGVARVNLNGPDLKVLDEDLMALPGMTREIADYILYYRISGSGEAVQSPLPAGRIAGNIADLRPLVQAAVDNATIPRRRVGSVFTVLNTQVRMPQVRDQTGQMVTPVVPSPLNDRASLGAVAGGMLDKCTASDDYEMVPRINVNTAPREVLMCLPGLEAADVDSIVANRPAAGTDPTAAWLVTAANLTPAKFKNVERYVSGRSGAYRVRSVGYFGTPGGPTASVEAVIEVVVEDIDGSGPIARPRILFCRDISDLGRVFDDLPR